MGAGCGVCATSDGPALLVDEACDGLLAGRGARGWREMTGRWRKRGRGVLARRPLLTSMLSLRAFCSSVSFFVKPKGSKRLSGTGCGISLNDLCQGKAQACETCGVADLVQAAAIDYGVC